VTAAVRAALRQLPPVGENSSGPLGPGLLAAGLPGTIIRELQAGLADPAHPLTPRSKADQRDRKRKHSLSTRALRSASPSASPVLSPIQTSLAADVGTRFRSRAGTWRGPDRDLPCAECASRRRRPSTSATDPSPSIRPARRRPPSQQGNGYSDRRSRSISSEQSSEHGDVIRLVDGADHRQFGAFDVPGWTRPKWASTSRRHMCSVSRDASVLMAGLGG